MRLREVIPFLDDIVKVHIYTSDGKKRTIKTTGVSIEQKCAKYLDFEVFSIKATSAYTYTMQGVGSIAWIDITIKEYHAHL